MSVDLECRLSFPRKVSLDEESGVVECIKEFSGCGVERTSQGSGFILYGVPVKFDFEREGFGYVGLNFFGGGLSAAQNIMLKTKLRESLVNYFSEIRDFSVNFQKPMNERDVSGLLFLIQDSFGAEVRLDGRTRMLMRNGRMKVEGSIRKKPVILPFKCEYFDGKCRKMLFHLASFDDSSLEFYGGVRDLVEGYKSP